MKRLEQRFSVTPDGLSMKWVLTEESLSEEREAEDQEDAQQEHAPLALCA
jgi:hypothetical protein